METMASSGANNEVSNDLSNTDPDLAAGRLLCIAAAIGHIDIEQAERVAQSLLSGHPSRVLPLPGRSELNWNGSPLQLLYTVRKGKTAARLLGDPGFHLLDPARRYAAGREALFSSLALANAHSLRDIAETALNDIVSPTPDALARYAAGSMWLAVALGAPGAAMYVAPDPGVERWQKARQWVLGITRKPDAALSLIAALAKDNFLLGVGIEGTSADAVRFKLYWRMTAALPLSAFGIPMLNAPSMSAFLAQALGRRAVPLNTLNFSAGFDLVSGLLHDVKVDVSWHGRTRSEALQMLRYQVQHFDMASPAVAGALNLIEQAKLEIGCLGLGLDTAGEHRINTYLFQH